MRSLLILSIALCKMVSAQDTIFTRSATIPGKVLEISSTEVRYKKSSMPDGPTYIQNKSDIIKIRYTNGQVEVFSGPTKEPERVSTGEKPKESEKPGELQKPAEDPNADYYGGGFSYTNGNQIFNRGSLFIYQNRKISEKKLHLMLNDTGDKQIMALVKRAQKDKRRQYIGFAAIPLGFISLVTVASAYTFDPNTGATTSVNEGQVATGGVLALLATACPVFAIKCKSHRKRCNREAVKLYNQKF